jgi:hypothetical protein
MEKISLGTPEKFLGATEKFYGEIKIFLFLCAFSKAGGGV